MNYIFFLVFEYFVIPLFSLVLQQFYGLLYSHDFSFLMLFFYNHNVLYFHEILIVFHPFLLYIYLLFVYSLEEKSQIGIAVGWLLGIWLHNYILTVVPPDQVMFDPNLWIGAYIIPFVVVNIVTFVLKFYINKKLINVDMIEALKSVD